ncbi:MAG TPA: OmpA family protein [Tepidisphaeraceae bacterium]|nr:OmpA family protein [Tepidisphaeraceae bacterium]
MAKGCKKCKKAECEECPEWIFTFADLVMLMMGFFVILWVLKPPAGKAATSEDNADWIKVVAAIREAFGYIPNPQSKDPVDIEMLLHRIKKVQLDGDGDGGTVPRERHGPDGIDDEVTTIRIGAFATEGGKLIFAVGDATLSPDAKAALSEIADLVRGHRNLIMIKGHASMDDFVNGTQEQNLDLSLRRAEAAAKYMESQGVDPSLIRVQGCSTYEPVVQGQYGPNADADNRRVEVEATATLVNEMASQPATIRESDIPSTLPAQGP